MLDIAKRKYQNSKQIAVMIRKIISLGKYTGVISIPKELLKKLHWRRGQNLEISSKRKSLSIKDAK